MTKVSQEHNVPFSLSAWKAHVKASRQSGLSRAEYCRQHNLSYHTLTYWCNKVKGKSDSGRLEQVNLVPVSVPLAEISQTCTKTSGVQVRLSGDIVIEVAPVFSHDALRQVVQALNTRV